MWFCYILYSKRINQTYTGFSSNLERRLFQHKHHLLGITTKRADDYELVWFSGFLSRNLAKDFEKYLKTKSGRVFMSKRFLGNLFSRSQKNSGED